MDFPILPKYVLQGRIDSDDEEMANVIVEVHRFRFPDFFPD